MAEKKNKKTTTAEKQLAKAMANTMPKSITELDNLIKTGATDKNIISKEPRRTEFPPKIKTADGDVRIDASQEVLNEIARNIHYETQKEKEAEYKREANRIQKMYGKNYTAAQKSNKPKWGRNAFEEHAVNFKRQQAEEEYNRIYGNSLYANKSYDELMQAKKEVDNDFSFGKITAEEAYSKQYEIDLWRIEKARSKDVLTELRKFWNDACQEEELAARSYEYTSGTAMTEEKIKKMESYKKNIDRYNDLIAAADARIADYEMEEEYDRNLVEWGKKAIASGASDEYVPTEPLLTEYNLMNKYFNGEINEDALKVHGYDDALWKQFTEGERRLYNTLHNDNPEKATEFYKSIESILKKRRAEATVAEAQAYAQEHPYIAGAKSVASNVIASPIAAIDNIADKVIFGKVDTYDTTSTAIREAEALQAAGAEEMKKRYGKKGETAYIAGIELSKMAIDLLVSKGLGKAAGALGVSSKGIRNAQRLAGYTSMGSRAASSTMLSVADRGGSDAQIITAGVASALTEIATEALPFEEFLNPKVTKNFFGSLLVGASQMPSNTVEEIIAEAGNLAIDAIVMQEQSENSIRKREYVLSGMSAEEAIKKVIGDNIIQLAEAGKYGAILGGMMGTLTSLAANVSQRNSTREVVKGITNSPDALRRVVQIGLENGNGEAKYVSELMAEGMKIDAAQTSRLVNSVITEALGKKGDIVNIIRSVAAIEGRDADYYTSQEAIDTARAVMDFVRGEGNARTNTIIENSRGARGVVLALSENKTAWDSVKREAQRRAEEMQSVGSADAAKGKEFDGVRYSYAGRTKSGIKKYVTDFPKDMGMEERAKIFKDRIATIFNLGAVKLKTDTKKIEILGDKFTVQKNLHGDDIASENEMQAKVNSLYDMAEILSEAEYVGKGMEPSYADPTVAPKNKAHKDVKYWYKFKNTISMDGVVYDVVFNIRDKGKEQYQYLIEFHEKNEGNSNQPYSQKNLRRTLDELPPTDSITNPDGTVNSNNMQNGEKDAQNEVVKNNVVVNEYSERLREENPKAYNNIVRMAKRLGLKVRFVKNLTDAKGRQTDGKITKDGIFIDADAKNPSRFVATHEVSHYLKQKSPKMWEQYQRYAIERLRETGEYDDAAAAKENDYKESEIDEEIACDYIGDMFDSEAELEAFIRWDRPFAVKIRDMWYSFLDKLGMLDEKAKAKQLWLKAYTAAMKDGGKESGGEKLSKGKEKARLLYDWKKGVFTVDENVEQKFQQKVDAWLRGEVKSDEHFDLGETPLVLRALGSDNLPMIYVNEVMWKMTGGKHAIAIDDIKKLPHALNNPIMVFKSSTVENSFVAITELFDKAGDSAISAIHLNKMQKRLKVNRIASTYGKENIENFLNDECEKGNLVYIDKIKSQQWSTNRGLQLPKLVQSITDNNIILQKEDVVNRYCMPNPEKNSPNDKSSVAGTRLSEAEERRMAEELEEQREYYEAELERQKEKYTDRFSKDKLKKRIDSDFKYLHRMVENPTDQRHIPEEMRADVAALMKCINFETKQLDRIKAEGKAEESVTAIRLDKIRGLYESIIRKAWGIDKNADTKLIDEYLSEDLRELMESIPVDESGEAKRLQDMSIEEMRAVSNVLRGIHHAVTENNNAFSKDIKETISAMSDNVCVEMADKRASRRGSGEKADDSEGLRKALAAIDKLLNVDMMQPWDMFHRIGGTLEKLYGEERKAFNRHIQNIQTAAKEIKKACGDIKIKSLTGKNAEKLTFTLLGGNSIELSRGQILSLYSLYMRPQGKEHLLEGGIVTGRRAKDQNGSRLSANRIHKVNETDLGKMFEKLSDKEKQMAKDIVLFMSKECARWGNEASMKLYGYEKYGEGWYFPIKVADSTLQTYSGEKGEGNLRTQSFTKKLVKNARNAVEVGDFFDIVISHINGMSLYNTIALPMLDMERVLNRTTGGETVRQEINVTHGKEVNAYLRKFHEDLNGSRKQRDSDGFVSVLFRNAKKASIGLNTRVLIQQPTSIVRAMQFISPIDFAAARYSKELKAEMQERVPIAYWKGLGFRDVGIGSSMKDAILGLEGAYDKVAMGGYGAADDFAWTLLYSAIKNEVKRKNPDIAPDSDAFIEKVRERFDYIADRSQVVDSVFHRTQNMRSNSEFTKNATMFMSEPLKTLNMFRTEIEDSLREGNAGKKLSRATAVYLFSNFILALAQAIPDTWREDDEDELYDENGVPLSLLKRYADNTAENFVDNLNPFNMVPYVKDIVSIIKGYDMKRMEYSNLANAIGAVSRLKKDNLSIPERIMGFVKPTAAVFGISIGNLMRDVEGITKTIVREIGDEYADYTIMKFKYNVKNPQNKERFLKYYKRALSNGRAGEAEIILKDYMSQTFKGKDFENENAEAVLGEMAKVYKKTESESVIYKMPDRKFSFDGEDVELGDEDYGKLVEGAYSILWDMAYDFANSKEYKGLSAEEKAEGFKDLKTYAQNVQKQELVDGYELEGWQKDVYEGEKDYSEYFSERKAEREYMDSRDQYKESFEVDEEKYTSDELGVIEKVESDAASYYASVEKGREYNEKTLRHIKVYDEKLSDVMPIEEYAGVRAYAKKTAAMSDGKESMKKDELTAYLRSTDYPQSVKRALFEAIGSSNWKNPF